MFLAAGACSGGGAALGPAGTVGPAPTTTSTTARPVDPAVIPEDLADIDEPYVQAVVDALFEVDAKATKIFVETQRLEPEAIEYLQAIYVPEEMDNQINIWGQDLALRGDELVPGMLHNDVKRIIDSSMSCVYVEVESDYSDVTRRVTPRLLNYLGLRPKAAVDDPKGLNPTSWMMLINAVNRDGTEPANPCDA